ncbi:hypothetical protein JW756_05660 [Candidatus Woesearchaeota archaeon]|nr:hypothetical protein [Candidatus Woesearchaeota archaeon]
MLIFLLVSFKAMIGEPGQPPLKVDKSVYEVEETVTLSINLDPSQYYFYYLLISEKNNSYTYKGDFNPAMFFYPTEEGIYTIALVEKSTGAIYYSLSFNVDPKPGAHEKDYPVYIGGTPGIGSGSPYGAGSVGEDKLANESINILNTLNITGQINRSTTFPQEIRIEVIKEKIISLEKDDFLPGEKLRATLNIEIIKNQEKFRLYHVFNNTRKKYMGDFGFIEFSPEGIGLHELVITDDANNVVDTYRFEVVDSIAQSFIKVIDYIGHIQEFSALLYDKSGRAISTKDNHVFETLARKENETETETEIEAEIENEIEIDNQAYDLEITPDQNILKRLRFNNLKFRTLPGELKIGVDNVPLNRLNVKNRRVIKAFALDPSNLDFTNGSATAVALGTELWKCKDWAFEAQACIGEWEKVMDLTPGQEYNITLTMDDPGFAETAITIINTQSYPTYRGNWTVMFNTTGVADLVIRVVDGTSWDYSEEPGQETDLRFFEVRCGNEILAYEWVNNSVLITNFSCSERAYETSQVLTVGVHTLEFRFGEDVDYAHNLVVYEYWLQTLNAEFNNGTKSNINVSADSFMLNRTTYPCTGSPSSCGSFSSNPPCSSTCGCTWTPSYCSNNGVCDGLAEAPCSSCPGCSWATSSCPLVEAWNGSAWVAEHEAFPFSIFKSVSRTTYDSLPSIKCIDGEAKIRIYESLPEITYLDDFKAYAVSIESNESTLRDGGDETDEKDEIKQRDEKDEKETLNNPLMKPDLEGRVRFMNKQVFPVVCNSTSYSSEDCLGLIKEIDKEFAEPVFNPSRIDDWLTLEFDNISSPDVKLYLVVRKQNFLDAYYIYMVHAMGKKNFPFFSEISALPGISWVTNKWWEDSLFFQVEVWDDRNHKWIRQAAFGAGHQLPKSGGADDFLVSVHNPCVADCTNKSLKLRLRFMTGSYGVDYAAVDDSLDPGFKVREMAPKSIVFSQSSGIQPASEFKRTMTKDDFFIVTYDCNQSEEIYTSISGYYNHGEFDQQREKDQISAWYEYIMLFTLGKEYVIQTAQEKGLYKGAKSMCEFESSEIEAQKRPDGLYIFIAFVSIMTVINLLILLFLFKQKKAFMICLLVSIVVIIIILIISSIPYVISGGVCSGTLNCGNYNASQPGCEGCSQCLWSPDTCGGSASNCSTFSSQSDCGTCGCTWQPYFLNGSLVSQAKDTGRASPVFTNIFIANTTPAGTNITWELRASTTQAGLSSAIWYTNLSQVPSIRWVQWRINLSSNGSSTPVVYDVNLTWTFTDNPPNVTALNYPGSSSILNFSLISFNFTAVDDFNFTNCTLYGNFTGVWAANKTLFNVINGSVNNITITLPDGSFIWNVLCYDNFDTPQPDWHDYNYSVIVDTTNPLVDFSTGTASDASFSNNAWIYVNVSVIESNEKNITFRLSNQSSVLNLTTLGAGNRSINFTSLADGTYYYNVTVCDNANHCSSTLTRTIYLDKVNPVISNWGINGTLFLINKYICLNATVNDAFSGVHTVTAQVLRPDMAYENITLLDTQITSCDNVNGNGVYSSEYFLQFSGNYTWQVVYANDSAGNTQSNITNLEWNVTTIGGMTVSMLTPLSDLKINESEHNYQYQQNCSVSCNPDGSNCTNVTLFAEYNPGVFQPITTLTTGLVNDENSFICGNLTSGGANCTHTFNITAGEDSGGNIWLIRCSASSNNVGSFVSSPVNLTVNNHPYPAFTFPQNNSWISGLTNLNASSSFDSDGTITNYLFEYDNNTGFPSSSIICNSASSNCTWNTTQQDQCQNNTKTCYLRVRVTDNDGLSNATYILIGFDTNGPVTTLDRPSNSSIVSGSSTVVNATAVDNEIGNISAVIFEYRQNSSASWVFACADSIGPTYDCAWTLSGLPDGNEYEFRAYANDSFGNFGGYDTHINITVDNSAPQISLVSPENNYIDTDGDLTFVYTISDLSPMSNCSLIINSTINQTNSSVQRGVEQYFYLSGLANGFQANWSINCTDTNGLKNMSATRNFSVQKNANMTIILSINRSSYTFGESISFTNNVTDDYHVGISSVNVSTAVIFANTTMPWWNSSWQRRKPITLSSASSLAGAMVEVNISGLDGNITSCDNELRVVLLTNAKEVVSVNRTVVSGDNSNYCVVRFRANITAGVNNTAYYAYYNNSAASNPNNNETRLTQNRTTVAIGGSLISTGAGYNVDGGSYINTTSDDGAYYAVGRNNGAFSGTDLGAYINLSYNTTVAGINESDFTSINFTINYCHTADVTAPITCTGVSPGTANNPANAEMYDFDSSTWVVFDDFFQDTGSVAERNGTLYNSSNLGRFIQNSTGIVWVRYETDIVLGTGADTSFALDYANLNNFYLERIYGSVGSIGQTQRLVASNSSITNYDGLWDWNWNTTGQLAGTYSAVSLAAKTSYNNDYDYVWFNLSGDNLAPVIKLISPENNSFLKGTGAIIFYYNVSDNNSAVANCSLIINGSIINTTNSPQEDITLNFTQNTLGESQYNWSINCTDPGGNQNSSETRKLNIDNTGPVALMDRPLNDSTINAVIDGFFYNINASVTDQGVGNMSRVIFLYRYNSTDTWKPACIDSDGVAPYNCSWGLTGLTNGDDYEVLVYANDTLGNMGANNSHINITIITTSIAVNTVLIEDDIYSPVDQIDLQAGTTKNVYCNVTVVDPIVYTDIVGVNATFFSLSTTYDAADNNRTHYTNNSCAFLTGGGDTAYYQCAFTLWHFAINGTWNCTAVTWNTYTGANSSDNTSVNQLFALNVSTSVVDYGSLQPDNISSNVTVNISNVGNMPMNVSVYGFGGDDETTGAGLSMVCQINNITIEFERFATNNTADYNSKRQLSGSLQDLQFTIPSKNVYDDVVQNSTYWQFMVPPQYQAFGQCNGSVVFVAESP